MSLQIGFANTFYTLWDIVSEKKYVTDMNGSSYVTGTSTQFTYYQNLSTDLKKAQEKAKEKGCTLLEPDTSIKGKTQSWNSYTKSEEQIERDEEARKKRQEVIQKEEAEYAADRIKHNSFLDEFINGRPFTSLSNFKFNDQHNEVSISIEFEPNSEYEQELYDNAPYGIGIILPIDHTKLKRKEYRGFEYYTLPGYRTMKNKKMEFKNNTLTIL